jgi:hypothetical protein
MRPAVATGITDLDIPAVAASRTGYADTGDAHAVDTVFGGGTGRCDPLVALAGQLTFDCVFAGTLARTGNTTVAVSAIATIGTGCAAPIVAGGCGDADLSLIAITAALIRHTVVAVTIVATVHTSRT